jgi:hypothetical protein
MNKRDYLRSLGFEVGSRGRFSAEMQAALANFVEDTPVEEEPIPKIPNTPKRKDGITVYTAVLKGGQVIKFDYCPTCKDNVIYCHCRSPKPPHWLAEEVDSWTASE